MAASVVRLVFRTRILVEESEFGGVPGTWRDLSLAVDILYATSSRRRPICGVQGAPLHLTLAGVRQSADEHHANAAAK